MPDIWKRRILAEPRLELLAPVQLNIVCFRYRAVDADKVNRNIVIDIQESGIAAPSTTMLDGRLAIRAAIVNHRTEICDIDALISAVLEFGGQRSGVDRRPVPECRAVSAASDVTALPSGGALPVLHGLTVIQQLLLVGDRVSWLPSVPGTGRRSGYCC